MRFVLFCLSVVLLGLADLVDGKQVIGRSDVGHGSFEYLTKAPNAS